MTAQRAIYHDQSRRNIRINTGTMDDTHRDVRDLARGALVNLVGKLGRLTKSSFAVLVKVLFGAGVLGIYEIAWGVVSALSKIGLCGLHRGAMKLIVEARATEDTEREEGAIGAALVLSMGVSLVVVALAIPGAKWLVDLGGTLDQDHAARIPDLVSAIRIMLCVLPFINAAVIFIDATRALRIMRYDVYVSSVGGPLILLAGACAAGLMDWRLWGLAIAQVLSGFGMCLLALHYFRQHFSLAACLRRLRTGPPWKPLVLFSVPVAASEFLGAVLLRLDMFILLLYVDFELIGIYALARRISSVIQKVPHSFDPIFSSIVSDLAYRGQYQQMGVRFASVARWSLIVNLAILATLLLLGENILALLGQDTVAANPTLMVFCVGMAIHGVFASSEPLLIMSGRQNLSLLNTVAWLLLNLGLNYVLIPRYGILGAGIGTAVCRFT